MFLHDSTSNGVELRTYFETVPIPTFGYRTFRDVAELASIEILTPTATPISYKLMGGLTMNAWYNRSSDYIPSKSEGTEDIEGMERSLEMVKYLFDFAN